MMKTLARLAPLALLLATLPPTALGDDNKSADGFVPMFNGKNLDGWVNVNCHPRTFYVKDDMIVTTGLPTGYLRTARQYENFIAEFDWMHMNKKEMGNSGFFVWADPLPATGTGYTRGIEVQVLVNLNKEGMYTSHGDIFSIWGATCKPDRPHPKGWARCLPSENRCKGGGEWNHYKVTALNGAIKLEVNGKEVSGVSECRPRKGYLALESEGSECRYRNLKIKELPSTNPKPEEICELDPGFSKLYNGLDLDLWEAEEGHQGHWEPRNWILHYDGKSEESVKSLYLSKTYGDYDLIVDWKIPTGKEDKARPFALILRETNEYLLTFTCRTNGRIIVMESVEEDSRFLLDKTIEGVKPSAWNRVKVSLHGSTLSAELNGRRIIEKLAIKAKPTRGEVALMNQDIETDYANIFIRPGK